MYCLVFFVVAILTNIFQVVQVQCDVWIADIARRNIFFVMHNVTRLIYSSRLAPLTQSVAPGYYLLPCSLPCGGLIKALCIFFHGPTALSVNGLWVMCIATP